MSHLGDNLSALVDGELSGADLDRANAHLASCDKCRGEAATLRLLKRELRALVADAGDDDALTRRLLAMAVFTDDQSGLDGQDRRGSGHGEGNMTHAVAPRPAFRTYHEAWDRRPLRSSRHRYFTWGAVSLAVVGGLGAAAFSIGGGSPGPGTGTTSVVPQVVPQVEWFNAEHAIDSGDVPYPNTSPTHPAGRATKLPIPQGP
ncbi:MAG: anti-sigma factor family protein [Trebonia sp.]